jgi:hypothetical protein
MVITGSIEHMQGNQNWKISCEESNDFEGMGSGRLAPGFYLQKLDQAFYKIFHGSQHQTFGYKGYTKGLDHPNQQKKE